MRHVLTRQQLYDMVWERAVSKVAPELGISDVGLRKICLKHDIPLPDARYRGLVGAGRPARRKPLPALKAGQVDHIVIHAVEPHETAPEVDAAVNARRNDAPVSIPEALHPLVKQSLSVAKRARVDLNGAVRDTRQELEIRGDQGFPSLDTTLYRSDSTINVLKSTLAITKQLFSHE